MNFNFRNVGEKGQLSFVAADGTLFFPPQTCKDYAKEGITWAVNREFCELTGVYNPGVKKKAVDITHPIFAIWSGANTAERNAEKFMRLINKFEDILGIVHTIAHPVDTGKHNKVAPWIAKADPWWIKSPVAADAYMLLMRLSPVMRISDSIDVFIKRTIGREKLPNYQLKSCKDYLETAKVKGNISGLLEKSLPCLNREAYGDWLLSRHERGFSAYDKNWDAKQPMDLVALIKLKMVKKKKYW